jgi:hypothetical protein
MKQVWQMRASSITFFSEAAAGALQNKPFKTLSSICTTSESYVYDIYMYLVLYYIVLDTSIIPPRPTSLITLITKEGFQ